MSSSRASGSKPPPSRSRVTSERVSAFAFLRMPSLSVPPTKPPTSFARERLSLSMAAYSAAVQPVTVNLAHLSANCSQSIVSCRHCWHRRLLPVEMSMVICVFCFSGLSYMSSSSSSTATQSNTSGVAAAAPNRSPSRIFMTEFSPTATPLFAVTAKG